MATAPQVTAAGVLLAAAFICAPGVGLTFVLHPPGTAPLTTRLALVVPFGYAFIALLALAIALAHVLTTAAFVTGFVVLTLAVWAVALRHGARGGHLARWWDEVRAERFPILGGLAAIAALAVTRFSYSPALNLADQTPLRYWADGVEIADAHRIPALTLQWGHLFPTTVSKVALNSFNAAGTLVMGRGALAPMGALLVVGSVGLLLVAFGLARELGLRLTAPFIPVLLFANAVIGPRNMTQDLINDRAENWGRLVTLAAILLAVRAMRSQAKDRGWLREAVPAGVLFGVGAVTHLIPVLIGATFVAGWALTRWLAERPHRAAAIRVGRSLAMAGGLGILLAGVVLLAAPGEVGLGGGTDAAAYRRLAQDLGQPPAFDPTRYLALGQAGQHQTAGDFYDPPSATYHEYVRRAVGETRLRRPLQWTFPLILALALVVLLLWGDADLRALGGAAYGLAAAILAAGFAFNYRFDVYVMAEFGPRRLFDYTGMAVVLLATGVAELGSRRLSAVRLPGGAGPVPWLPPAVSTALLAVLAVYAVPRNVSVEHRERFLVQAERPLAWIADNVACSGRILADRRTLATFETFTRHAGVTEGMGPYLRPQLLNDAILELFAARSFFEHPLAGREYLVRERVAAVVVTSYNQILGGVGGPLKAAVNIGELEAAPFLVPVIRTASITVYRVRTFDPGGGTGGYPDVRHLPGYRCSR